MEAQLQRLEVERAVARDHDLAVEHAARRAAARASGSRSSGK